MPRSLVTVPDKLSDFSCPLGEQRAKLVTSCNGCIEMTSESVVACPQLCVPLAEVLVPAPGELEVERQLVALLGERIQLDAQGLDTPRRALLSITFDV